MSRKGQKTVETERREQQHPLRVQRINFSATFFLDRKKKGCFHQIVNLKNLNQFVPYSQIIMEGL